MSSLLPQSKKQGADPRVLFGLMLVGVVAGLYANSEFSLVPLLLIGFLWFIIVGKSKFIPMFIVGYVFLDILTYAALFVLSQDSSASAAVSLSSFSISSRKAFIPVMFAIMLATVPTGSFMASLNEMKMPKAVGIGVATGLRFFPTLGEEYRSIRNSQKFRNVGVGFWDTLVHIPRVLNCVFIPLIIRITKISEELSASITVRGMRFHNDIVSYRPIRFGARDILAFLVTALLMIAVVVFDNLRLGGLV